MALYMGRKETSYVEVAAATPYPTEDTTPVQITSRITLGSPGNCTSGFGCSGGSIHIPTVGCDDCHDFAEELERVKAQVVALEQRIGNKTDTIIAMTDTNNQEVSVTVLAE